MNYKRLISFDFYCHNIFFQNKSLLANDNWIHCLACFLYGLYIILSSSAQINLCPVSHFLSFRDHKKLPKTHCVLREISSPSEPRWFLLRSLSHVRNFQLLQRVLYVERYIPIMIGSFCSFRCCLLLFTEPSALELMVNLLCFCILF